MFRAIRNPSIPYLVAFLLFSSPALSSESDFLRRIDNSSDGLEVKFSQYSGPSETDLVLVGMVHIADPAFYQIVRETLGDRDLLLFEGVAPSGFYGPPFLDDPDFNSEAQKVRLTRIRLAGLKRMALEYLARRERAAVSLEELLNKNSYDIRYAISAEEAVDAWGRRFEYRVDPDGRSVHFKSLGKDGRRGGTGVNRDLTEENALTLPVDTDAVTKSLGQVYAQLAEDAELVPQPKDLNYLARKNIRADVSSDMLWGQPKNSFAFSKYWLWRDALPTILLQFQISEAKWPPGTKIGIIYGAGHAEDQDAKIRRMGFRQTAERWVTVFTLDPKLSAGVRAARLNFIERIIDER